MGLYTRFYNRWTHVDHHIAIVDENQEYTYALVDTHVRSICSFFQHRSIQQGDVIAVCAQTSWNSAILRPAYIDIEG